MEVTLDLRESIDLIEEQALSILANKVTRMGATFVELGSWKGHSASIISKVVKILGGHLYCVDHWKGNEGTPNVGEACVRDVYKVFETNLHYLGLWDCITPIVMDSLTASREFADRSIDFLFMDADHRYKQFKENLEVWLPKIKINGIICGHDCERYYTKLPPSKQEQINSHLGDDYIKNFCHPGVIKALFNCFDDDYKIMYDTRIWYKEIG